MLNLSRVIKVIGIAMCLSIATPVLAESAPVYDADAMPQDQEEGIPDQSQFVTAGPSTADDGVFVPMQQQPAVMAAAAPQSIPSAPPPSSFSPSNSAMNVEQRVQRVEQQVNNIQSADTGPRVESLQNEVQSLRGQVEQLTHQLEQVKTQQKTMYTDLDSRLSQGGNATKLAANSPVATSSEAVMNGATNKAAPTIIKTSNKVASDKASRAAIVESFSPKAASQPNVAEEQQIYQTAYNLIKAKKYNEAVAALQNMLKKYPSGQFASNAHYWLGELYGLMGKSDKALAEFSAVVQTYPDSPRVSDAQLKVGLIYASELKWPDAKVALKKVVSRYPGSASARLASEQLKQIKKAGH